MIELENSLSSTHRLYGTPKFKKENEKDEWSDWYLRFIIFSPDLKPMPESIGKIGRICYTPDECWGEPFFKDCQIAMPDDGGCTYLVEHGGDYWGDFKPIEVSSVWFNQAEMTLTEGEEGWLNANVDPWDATDQSLIWASSDESVATVNSNDGRNAYIKAIKQGKATMAC